MNDAKKTKEQLIKEIKQLRKEIENFEESKKNELDTDLLNRKLQESETHFSMLMQQSPAVVEIYDLDGLQISVNKAYEELWNFPASTTVNKFNVLKSKEVAETGLIEYVKRAYDGESVTVPEYEFDPKGKTESGGHGRNRWLSTKIFPLKDKSGKVSNIVITHEDITDVKTAELKALNAQLKAQQYLNIAEVMLLSIDHKGIITLINPKGCELLGYSKEEIIGQNWFDLALPKNQVTMVKKVAKKVFSGEIESVKYYENNIITKSGEERLFAFHNSVLKDESGAIVGTLSSGEDITEKRKSQINLEESKAFNETLLNTSTDVIYVYDLTKSKNVYSNERISEILGYSAKEIAAFGDKLISSLMHEDDFKIYINDIIPLYQKAKDGELIVHDYRMKHKNGNWHWLRSKESIFQRLDNGSPKQIFGMISDVTESKLMAEKVYQSNEKLDLALKGADAGLWSWNIKTGEDLLDERWCGILGYKMEEVPQVVSSWEKLIHPDDKEKIFEVVNKHLEDESVDYNDEYRMKCKNGEWKWILAIGKLVERDEEGNPARMTGIIIDIDKKKQAEEELRNYQENLESLVKERTEELETKNKKLDDAMKVFVGRELTIKNLQAQIKALQKSENPETH